MEKLEHEKMVAKLAKPGEEIVSSLTPEKVHMAHMVAGISGEAGELLDAIIKTNHEGCKLDRINAVEELGDLEFYMEGLRQPLGITREVACWPALPEKRDAGGYTTYFASKISIYGSEILDAIKKHVVYGTVLDVERVSYALGQMEKFMDALRGSLNISREECLAANIQKLRKRYENLVYSDQQAAERADKKE